MNPSRDPDPLARAAATLPGPLGRLLARLKTEERPLRHIQVEVTSVCPGACLYCPRGILGGAWRPRSLSAERFAALLPLMRLSGRVHLQGWGEPYAHPRLTDFAELARKAGCSVSTTSCGLIMNGELAARTVECGMDVVAFSLAGTDEESNAARRKVPLSRVAAAVRLLNAAKASARSRSPVLHLSYLLLADRVEAARGLPELMERWDVPVCVVSTLDMPVLPEHLAWAFRPGERDKIARARDLLEETAARAARLGRSVRFCLPGTATGNCREDAARSCYVDADGLISPCIYLNVPFDEALSTRETLLSGRRFLCGSVPGENPVRVWRKEAYADFRADLAHGAVPDVCRDCPKRFEHMH